MVSATARMPRLVAAAIVFLALTWLFASPVFAQEEVTTTTVAGSETTVSEAPDTTTGLQPALPVEPEEETAADPDWTYRYLIPTALVLTVLIVLVTSVKYFSDVVRKRYRVVE